MDEKELEEYGKVRREYKQFKKMRRQLGLKSFLFINIKQMEKNLKGSE